MSTIVQLTERLSKASERHYINPFSRLVWPDAVDCSAWYMSPELCSLYDSDAFVGLPVEQRKRLSLYEAVNFFSLNIHGEKALVAELARRLYSSDFVQTTPYLLHFLAEENKHMVYFGRFCLKYANKIYPSRRVPLQRDYLPGEEDFLFFARVLIFEEIVDAYNRHIGRDRRVAGIARQINWIHHCDESRHLAFGRKITRDLFERYRDQWPTGTIRTMETYLSAYLNLCWREYYNPLVYRDAGLADAYKLARQTWQDPTAVAHRSRLSEKLLQYFAELGMNLGSGLQ